MVSLPKPDAHGLPETTIIAVPVPDDGLMLYRLVDDETPTLRDFEERRTRPQAERDGIPELFRLSVSHWLRYEQAAGHSIRRRFPDRRFGWLRPAVRVLGVVVAVGIFGGGPLAGVLLGGSASPLFDFGPIVPGRTIAGLIVGSASSADASSKPVAVAFPTRQLGYLALAGGGTAGVA